MTDLYAVIGNPVAHSKSPQIHAEFAKQTKQDMAYGAILAPLEDFPATVEKLRREGYRGANVTVPFKREAWRIASDLAARALDAESVNTLSFENEKILGDNTDGAGLVNDIVGNLRFDIRNTRILLMGAGGAARGVIMPLAEQRPGQIVIANRTMEKALQLAEKFSITAKTYSDLAGDRFDIVINATSSSLKGELPPLPSGIFADNALAYDMMYGKQTPFMEFAREQGASEIADGLGMLVEQAAESFFIWRGVRPETKAVIEKLKSC
ncbi:MAG: shikimate dehydrogenase [Burkholderiales bacterium]|nr:shikimate dehydrogenase [Burkholderiales bacterium]